MPADGLGGTAQGQRADGVPADVRPLATEASERRPAQVADGSYTSFGTR